MKRKRINYDNLPQEEKELLNNRTLAPDIVSFMVDLPVNIVVQHRYRNNNREKCAEASRKVRAKIKEEIQQKFGGMHKCYNYWTPKEIDYILHSTDSDKEMAKRLCRTIYSIQKKRQRELQRRRENES